MSTKLTPPSSPHQFTPPFSPKLHPRPPLPTTKPLSSSTSPPPPPPSPEASMPLSILRVAADWADEIKERGVRRHRKLYTPPEWAEHRSSRRHLRHLLSSLSSRVILSLVPPVSTLTAAAAVLAAYNSAVSTGVLPPFFPLLHSSSLPYQLTAPALALLLVFRTEASYARFQEGRQAWMKVIAGAGEMATMVMSTSLVAKDGAPAAEESLRRAVLSYIMAFPVVLKCHVLNGPDTDEDLRNLLEKEDLEVVMKSKHRPHCVLEFIVQSFQLLQVEGQRRNILESKISCFHEGITICEQLMGIPIPLSYTRLTSRFLVLWHLTLPIILWDECKWMVIPATFISAASLFCIEEVGVLIEEPFPMLALDDMCKQFHDNIQEAISLEQSVHRRLTSKMKIADQHSINGWPHS